MQDPALGIEAAVEALGPARSEEAIKQKARSLGYSIPRQKRVAKIPAGADEAIRRRYTQDATVRTVADLAIELGQPRWWITKRASQLGLQKVSLRGESASLEEDVLIERLADAGLEVVIGSLRSAGLRCDEAFVLKRISMIKALRLDRKRLTPASLSKLLGVDRKTVENWINHSGLNARRVGASWTVDRGNLKLWIAENPDRIDLKKVTDSRWFLSLLTT